ncbi:HMG1/2-like protein [Dioscorea cayenensis subsp. rotundata]|uniref:HMG1/2-like protein n=1 Tax=Dioscorea cayennensis subsp. rotundata TaxID=55577 RepID=A0AB40D8U7_DIOCR|nr:HMG1/2-like protein [Dioscorea cayenensis subsp. rotundata]
MKLEVQVVEKAIEVVKKPRERKKAISSMNNKGKTKKEKKSKNPNLPKCLPIAFFLFMDDFRKEYKATNPCSKSVAVAAKEDGERWKSMSDEEKNVYVDAHKGCSGTKHQHIFSKELYERLEL